MRQSVLVVDDDRGAREIMTTCLCLDGFNGIATANGLEALTYLRSGGSADVILLDLRMPVMNGFDFREQQLLDPILAAIPVVIMTGEVDVSVLTLRPAAWFEKPVDVDQIIGRVRDLVLQKTQAST